jgi:hypothetical protein
VVAETEAIVDTDDSDSTRAMFARSNRTLKQNYRADVAR